MIKRALVGRCSGAVTRRSTYLRHIPQSKRPGLLFRINKRSIFPLNAKKRSSEKFSASYPEPSIETEPEEILPTVAAAPREESLEPQLEEKFQQYYESVPAAPPQFPVNPPPKASESSTSLPPWVWIMVGVLLATVFTKIMNFVSRPQQAMADIMMKQMMNQMQTNQGGSPFGSPPAYDTTATSSPQPVSPFQPAGSTSDASKNGSATPKAEATTASPVDQSAFGKGQAQEKPPPSQGSFFQDVNAQNQTKKTAQPVSDEEADKAVDFMFETLKNPQMRGSLYQFLPENMRNPEMLDTVMASPMVKEQFKSMMTPGLLQQIKSFQNQVDNPQIRSQMEQMNVSPDVLMQKLMGEPEIMQMMQKPNVMSAVMDLQQNPQNINKYMNDPEVMQFMMKMNELTLQAQMQSKEGAQPNQTETVPASNPEPPKDKESE